MVSILTEMYKSDEKFHWSFFFFVFFLNNYLLYIFTLIKFPHRNIYPSFQIAIACHDPAKIMSLMYKSKKAFKHKNFCTNQNKTNPLRNESEKSQQSTQLSCQLTTTTTKRISIQIPATCQRT